MNNSILKHVTGLTRYRASRYFARLPSRTAESGSLALCTVHFLSLPSDPAVTGNVLAIWIVFPLVGVTPAYRRLGLPAMPGKQKRPGLIQPGPFLLPVSVTLLLYAGICLVKGQSLQPSAGRPLLVVWIFLIMVFTACSVSAYRLSLPILSSKPVRCITAIT